VLAAPTFNSAAPCSALAAGGPDTQRCQCRDVLNVTGLFLQLLQCRYWASLPRPVSESLSGRISAAARAPICTHSLCRISTLTIPWYIKTSSAACLACVDTVDTLTYPSRLTCAMKLGPNRFGFQVAYSPCTANKNSGLLLSSGIGLASQIRHSYDVVFVSVPLSPRTFSLNNGLTGLSLSH
jgi:hypothetical protein